MFEKNEIFSSFAVDDLSAAKEFYGQTLGLNVSERPEGLELHLQSGGTVFVYAKPEHTPASFTVLNIAVDDIDAAVKALVDKGIVFEKYPEMTDDNGIARGKQYGQGPDIAWFKDPAGNILSVLHG